MDLLNVVQVDVVESVTHLSAAVAHKVDAFMHTDSALSAHAAISSDCCSCRNNPA